MKITDICAQVRTPNRVSVSVDGKYRFSLDIFQVGELGLRVGKDYTEKELQDIEQENVFGKLYARALEYSMLRPRSVKEIRDYLWKKTKDTKVRNKKTGEWRDREGVSQEVADRVLGRLIDKGYVDDEKFAHWWIDNRNVRKGTSFRKLEAELRAKGVSLPLIQQALQDSGRKERDELEKIIKKKANKYDELKLAAYLVRQGFSYEDIRDAIENNKITD